ncbi:MAG: hypothetical protein AAF125_03985 [Chloroflexota bacterium]
MFQDLGFGVQENWIREGAIVHFFVPNTSREAVDVYIEASMRALDTVEPGETLYVLHDFSSDAIDYTRYFRAKLDMVSERLAAERISTVSAIVLPRNFAGQVMRVAGEIFTARSGGIIQKYFTDMDRASAWLNKQAGI